MNEKTLKRYPDPLNELDSLMRRVNHKKTGRESTSCHDPIYDLDKCSHRIEDLLEDLLDVDEILSKGDQYGSEWLNRELSNIKTSLSYASEVLEYWAKKGVLEYWAMTRNQDSSTTCPSCTWETKFGYDR